MTRTTFEMQHHAGKLDQFILAIHKVRTVASVRDLPGTLFQETYSLSGS